MDIGICKFSHCLGTSDVDIAVVPAPEAGLSLTGFARLRLDLTAILGRTADLTEWVMLIERALPSARRDAVEDSAGSGQLSGGECGIV